MRCIMVMFDSLNRHMLPPYAPDTWVQAPNFRRLAERAATFSTSYVCSMPCMPARRDLHTGRPNFLHCPWGPLEPFDDSVPQMLQEAGVYTHLCSDHYHYWEDGGATYHGRYSSWEFYRGQEGDPHIGQVADPEVPENLNQKGRRSDWVNRPFQRREADLPQSRTFEAGCRFIETNAGEDDWFLQIECFDPHEPFFSNRRYQDLYSSDYDGPLFDWPSYGPVRETPEQVAEVRRNYAALVSKCDASLGDVLDLMDRHRMWDDTMLVLWTDHGFLLGEHGGYAKNWPPLYEELSHTPFFVWDPRSPGAAGQTRNALVQPAIDLGPTLLRFFGQEPTEGMRGHDLAGVVAGDRPVARRRHLRLPRQPRERHRRPPRLLPHLPHPRQPATQRLHPPAHGDARLQGAAAGGRTRRPLLLHPGDAHPAPAGGGQHLATGGGRRGRPALRPAGRPEAGESPR